MAMPNYIYNYIHIYIYILQEVTRVERSCTTLAESCSLAAVGEPFGILSLIIITSYFTP